MTSQLLRALLPVLLFAGVAGGAGCSGHRGGAPSLEFHHRFSAPVRRWADARGHDLPGGWPAPGGATYIAALAGHDRHRALKAAGSGAHPPLTFSQGNATLKVSNLGFLHYALVTVGTPGHTFMVALDTGSDLFWLPCQGDGCMPPASGTSGAEMARRCYVVYVGRVPGAYEEWKDCQKQVNNFSGNSYQGYESREVAEEKWRRHGRKKWRNFLVITTLLLFMVGYVFYFIYVELHRWSCNVIMNLYSEV